MRPVFSLKRVLFVNTGGTIDSEAYENPYDPPQYVTTLSAEASKVFEFARVNGFASFVDRCTWVGPELSKDSKKFTSEEIIELAELIKQDHHELFVIAHGTDFMTRNSRILKAALEGSGKTVIMVGAMVPISMHQMDFKNFKIKSDGVNALEHALHEIHNVPEGVHVTGVDIHTGRREFFDPDTVEKDRPASLMTLQFTLKPAELQLP